MKIDVRISYTNFLVYDLLWVYGVVTFLNILIKGPRKSKVEDVLFNPLQSHHTKKVPHLVMWTFSSMKVNAKHSELGGNFPFRIKVNLAYLLK